MTTKRVYIDEDIGEIPTYRLIDSVDKEVTHVGFLDDGSGVVIADTHGNSLIFEPQDVEHLRQLLRYSRTRCYNIKLCKAFGDDNEES